MPLGVDEQEAAWRRGGNVQRREVRGVEWGSRVGGVRRGVGGGGHGGTRRSLKWRDWCDFEDAEEVPLRLRSASRRTCRPLSSCRRRVGESRRPAPGEGRGRSWKQTDTQVKPFPANNHR